MKKGDIKVGKNREKYVLIESLGKGGQAAVWKVKNEKTKEYYAYKEYKHNTFNIRANIEDLIKIGKFKDKNGKILEEVVLPITIVECDGDSFGYIMDLVDLKDYTVIKKAFGQKCPSCKAICIIVQNFARVFETLHISYGMCYKDVNEGNIFFNPHTGDIKIIDNDNIGYADRFTIKGTSGYMAPEVILGSKPNHNSDRFSFAVFVYRLLTGGFPFEGPYTEKYCEKNDVLPDDARKVIFGTNAIFVWHPTNKLNSIEKSKDPKIKGQVECWMNLPDSVKNMFISTFVTNLPTERQAERTTDADWKEKFIEIEQNLVECPHCGKITFSESGKCFECSGKLNNSISKLVPASTQTNIAKTNIHKHRVLFKILSIGEKKKCLKSFVADVVHSNEVSKNLGNENLFKILYRKKTKEIGIRNLSSLTWTIIYDNKTTNKDECKPGEIKVLKAGMTIRIIKKIVHLNVLEIK